MIVNFDPVIFSVGPLQVRWYGLMYVLGFLLGSYICKKLIEQGFTKMSKEKIDSLVTYLLIGMVIGARLLYVFVYNLDYHLAHPEEILAVWKGGLSFHGAMLGLFAGGYLFCKKNGLSIWNIADTVAICGAPGLFFGRMGNFINGELYGRVTDSSWGMIFPEGGPYKRHPSQLYEAVLEGLVLFLILFFLRTKIKVSGGIFAIFVGLYGLFRFTVEFFREPDVQLGYYFSFLTMGQLLCFIMMLTGVVIYYIAKKRSL